MACLIAIEGRYIVHAELGFDRPFDILIPFIPAFAMFVVRRKGFSYCFLFLYVALAIQMFFQARTNYLVSTSGAAKKNP